MQTVRFLQIKGPLGEARSILVGVAYASLVSEECSNAARRFNPTKYRTPEQRLSGDAVDQMISSAEKGQLGDEISQKILDLAKPSLREGAAASVGDQEMAGASPVDQGSRGANVGTAKWLDKKERSPLKQLARDAQGTETGPGAAAAGSAESCSRRLPNEIEPEPVIELVQTDSPAPAATEQEEVVSGAAALPVRDEDGEAFEAVTQPEKAEGELPVVGTITDKEVVEAATQPKKAEGELPASGTTDKEVVEAVTPPEKAEGELPASGNTDKEVFEAVAQPEKKEGEPPELGWFEAATLGNLKDLQLHVKRSTAQGSLSELLESVDAATGTATEDFRKTALHLSAQEGRVECCQWLLEAKADAMAMTKKKLSDSGGG
eukprot:Skav213800  [mRNA]  locus=scaffold1987:269429:277314:- [translate_table: standard]